MHKWFLIAVLCILFPVAVSAQNGKIAGKVTDRETGEPLIGANVMIDGSDRGAATNINGEFVILNVAIGKVTLVASYIGYQQITLRDILIKSNETTTADFQLPSEAFKVGEVEIIAEKPLVDKNVTNSKATVTQEEIENLPVRGVEGIVALQAGIVSQGGDIYVRGSRGDATGYIVDGVNANDPIYGGRALNVINNAIAEVNFQAGGYSAEFGGANGGLIMTTTRSGGRQFQVGFEAYTDSWSEPGEENFLGSYNYGNSLYALTVGGPLFGPVRFFVAAQNQFVRTPASYRGAYTLADQYDAALRNTAAHALLSTAEQAKVGIFDPRLGSAAKKIDYTYPGGYVVNTADEYWTFSGNATIDLNPINIRVGGSYGTYSGRNGAGILAAYQTGRTAEVVNGQVVYNSDNLARANQQRAIMGESEDYAVNLKLTHLLSQNTFYEVFLNYVGNFALAMDPDHQHNIFDYGDSIANAQFGYMLRGDGINPEPITMFGDVYSQFGEGSTAYAYQKQRHSAISGKINFVHQIGRTHEIKVGAEAQSYDVREFAITAFTLKSFFRNNPDATPIQQAVNSRTNNYGYDQWGAAIEDGPDGPKKPVFASAYLLDKIELEDLVINIGLRYDYIDTDTYEFVEPNNVKFDEFGYISQKDDNIRETEATATFSPRLGFSFPVTDQTVFYAQYGKFVQQTRLRDVFLGTAITASNIKGGYAITNPVGFGLKPETTLQYDFGFRQQIGDFLAFDIGAFYKDIRDQIQQQQITGAPNAQHSAYYAWVNGDFATTSGVSLKVDLRRVERVQASVDYTYSDARGTGSAPSSAFRTIWLSPTETPYLPKYTTLLDFNQTHRGSINVDYRFGMDDGPKLGGVAFLERTGLNLLFTFNSGHPYTRVDENSYENRRQPVEVLNESVTPWTFQIDARLDKTVDIAGLDVNFYIWVINLLDTKNVTDVFMQSGSASDNGYLSTIQGRQLLQTYAQYGQVFEDLYRDYYYQTNIMNADLFGPPRQVRLGLRIDF
ncbi:MAG: TonB-dependent receptor [Bacteroidota bacterium]|jgi:outer membrane receptor protein involved in Fe transport|nr:TonB-dependent receptor [Bacteroidota bacterium]